MLSPYAQRQWLTIAAVGALLVGTCLGLRWWAPAVVLALLAAAMILFFRDPRRDVPPRRHAVVSPADGRVRAVDRLDHYPPFDGPARRIRIFLSVLDVHVQRAPLHGRVASVEARPGPRRNALHADSAESNASTTMLLHHPVRDEPLAAVRQVVGAVARRIVCSPAPGEIVQRGQRYGIIMFGSTVELYLPEALVASVDVEPGRRVKAGASIVAMTRKTDPHAQSHDDDDGEGEGEASAPRLAPPHCPT